MYLSVALSAMLSKTDQKEAIASGSFGVTAAIKGETGKMVAFKRQSPLTLDADYVIKLCNRRCNEICNKEKTVPLE